jgi:hypothetical protein
MKQRSVEMYVGLQGGGEGGIWYTTFIDIPADTSEERLGEVAEAACLAALQAEGVDTVAFVGVYWEGDEEEDEGGEGEGE